MSGIDPDPTEKFPWLILEIELETMFLIAICYMTHNK